MRSLLRAVLLLPLVLADAYGRFLERLRPELSTTWSDEQSRKLASRRVTVEHATPDGELPITISTPNAVCRFRARTFSTKEPETLEWIDTYGGDGVLFDIGANVGLYSIYYALTKPGHVYAFEPSVFNLGQLARNLSANGVSDHVTIVTTPLAAQNQAASFHLTSTDEGGALSSFGETLGPDGRELVEVMQYRTLGVSLDFLLQQGVLPEAPTLIKIDVDGLEHLILRGAKATLANSTLKTVLIEVDDSFVALAAGVSEILVGAGFVMKEKRHSEMFEIGDFSTSYNQIWTRE